MSTAQWLSIIVTVVGGAAVWGSLKNEVGNLKTALQELKGEFNRSKEDQGKRIGKLEAGAEVQRALTGARGVRVPKESREDEDE